MCNTEKQATTEARRVLKVIKKAFPNGDWEIRVHENLGWHWNICTGTISLSPGCGGYSTLIASDNYMFTGLGAWTENNGDKNPVKSIKKAQKDTEVYVNQLLKVVNKNKKQLKN